LGQGGWPVYSKATPNQFKDDTQEKVVMMSSNLTLAVALAVVGGLSQASAAGMNLIENGDFEAGFADFATDYRYTRIDCCAGSAIVAPHIAAAFSGRADPGGRGGDHTTGSGLALFVNGSTESTASFWKQTVNLTPNTDYTFTS
jgi:hypothetical protein